MRVIVHIDLDAFYAQVEMRDNPILLGKPVAVTQYNKYQGGGIIALSYEAKWKGVKRGMRGDEAKKVCPELNVVQVQTANNKADLSKYRTAGTDVFEVCGKMARTVERTSIDEAYLDVTGMQ
eukprot:Awhi_evm1s14631